MHSLLLISLTALFLGPLLDFAASRFRPIYRVFDGVILAVIVILVAFEVLPETIEKGGTISIIVAGISFLAPFVASRFMNRNCHLDTSLLSLASAGVIAHAILDGMALASSSQTDQESLALAVILHRLPEGVAIWHIMRHRVSVRWAALGLAIVGSATTLGYFFGASLFHETSEFTLVIFQAIMAGVLLHVVFHKHHLGMLHSEHRH